MQILWQFKSLCPFYCQKLEIRIFGNTKNASTLTVSLNLWGVKYANENALPSKTFEDILAFHVAFERIRRVGRLIPLQKVPEA